MKTNDSCSPAWNFWLDREVWRRLLTVSVISPWASWNHSSHIDPLKGFSIGCPPSPHRFFTRVNSTDLEARSAARNPNPSRSTKQNEKEDPLRPRKRLHSLAVCLVVVLIGLSSVRSYAQSIDEILQELEVTSSLIDLAPFDIITLKKEEGGKSVQVNPLDFPNRKVPATPKDSDSIRCVITMFPGRVYEVKWKDVAKVTLWEELILDRAKKNLEEKNYSEAFEYLVYLRDNYPQMVDIVSLHQDFLFQSARNMANEGDLPHTLAALEELQKKFPDFRVKEVQNAISSVASKLIEDLIRRDDLGVARAMVMRLDKDYKGTLPVISKTKERFVEIAQEFRQKAEDFRTKGEFARARQAAVRMLEIEPDVEGGKDFLNQLIKEFPLVRVGVFQTSATPDPAAIADWGSMRIGHLVSSPIFEFRNTGSEGGMYRFAYGNAVQSDDRMELDLSIQNVGRTGVPSSLIVSESLLDRADVHSPNYFPSWAAVLQSVSVSGPERLRLRLRRPHVLPQAFLRWELPEPAFQRAYYQSKETDGSRTTFQWAPEAQPVDFQPREIIEIKYDDPTQAVNDLIKGEIEVIDRLFPADARRIGAFKSLKTEAYALPMVHLLVPRGKNAYLEDREFRRALLYAINREAILKDELLGDSVTPLDRVISGPFPAGASDSDALAYAYNTAIENLPYDPRLAKVLVLIAQANQTTRAQKRKEPAPKLPVLRLGVPNYESTKVAGQAIVQAWKIAGIESVLVPYDQFPKPEDDSLDILYLSAAVWEPATDAERLFGIGGPAETGNQYIVQAIGKLNQAQNWREVRAACQDLHSLVASHLPILPLWQISETLAYRSEIVGIAKKPLGLYQDAQKWRIQVR